MKLKLISLSMAKIIQEYVSKAVILMLFILSSTIHLISQQQFTPYSISAGIFGGANIHKADFQSLSGIDNCCSRFGTASGIAYGFFAGGSYLPETDFLGIKYIPGINLKYSNLSAEFLEEDFVGYIISGNDFTSAIINHQLKSKISAIIFEPHVELLPLDNFPISLILSAQLGIPMTKSFEQSEILVKPENVTFENGRKVRNERNGDIPDFPSLMLSFAGNVKYKILETDGISLFAFAGYSKGLSELSSNSSWFADAIQIGTGLSYRLPAKKLLPPQSPPLPAMPMPPMPEPEQLAAELTVMLKDKLLNSGDTLEINLNKKYSINSSQELPLFYFAPNSAKADSDIMSKITENISALYLSNKESKLNVKAYFTDDEDQNVGKQRADLIVSKLIESGFNSNMISSEIISIPLKSIPNPAIADEYRKVAILVNDRLEVINSQTVKAVNSTESLEFEVYKEIISNYENFTETGKIKFNSESKTALGEEINKIIIPSEDIIKAFAKEKSPKLSFSLNVISAIDPEMNVTAETELFLRASEQIESEYYNHSSNSFSNQKELFLCFFEFDDSQPIAVNNIAVEQAQKALAAGKKIELLPLTDNLGSPEYNLSLSKARANAGISILGKGNESIDIVYPEKFIFPNATPSQRILNRSVLIRIPD